MFRLCIAVVLAVVVGLLSISASDAAVIGQWNFNENTCAGGTPTAVDTSGNGLDGTMAGTIACAAGASGKALYFTSNGAYVEIPDSSLLSPSSSLVLEFSVNLQNYGGYYPLLRQNGRGEGLMVMIDPFTIVASFDQQGESSTTSVYLMSANYPMPLLPLNQWVTIKLAIDTVAGTAAFTLNGTPMPAQTIPTAPLLPINAPLRIGGYGPDAPMFTLYGAMDDVKISTNDPLISVILSGNGGGSVNSNPSGIACTSGTCRSYFPASSTVDLMAAPDGSSVFNGWSGACTGAGGCSVTMSADRTVTASFLTKMTVKVPGTPDTFYDSLNKAYLPTATKTSFLVRDGIFAEDVILDHPISLKVTGGYDPFFGTVIGKSIVKGTIAVQQGTLVARNLMIRSPASPTSYANPVDGAEKVAVWSPVRIKKAEQLDPATVTSATVSLWGKGRYGSYRVPGTVAYSSSLRLITIRHGGLLPGTDYEVRIAGAKTSTGTSVPDSTIAFATLRNQLDESVFYNRDGTIKRYILYPRDGAGRTQGSEEYVGPGADGEWRTSDDVVGWRESFQFSPTQLMTRRDTFLGNDYSLSVPYEYSLSNSVTRETFYGGDYSIFRVAGYAYDGRGLLDRRTEYVETGPDAKWKTGDDVAGTYTTYSYDNTGVKTRETTYRKVMPDGTVLTNEEVVGYRTFQYDGAGRLSRVVVREGAGTDGTWYTGDDGVSGYWDYIYGANGQLTRSVFRGHPGADGIWFTADDRILGFSSHRYDTAGNRTTAIRYAGPGADGVWFTADDVQESVHTYDTAW